MSEFPKHLFAKIKSNLPWLARYPFVRADAIWRKEFGASKKHIIFTVANHFEPSWSRTGHLDLDLQRRRLDDYRRSAEKIGNAVRDADGAKFRHTNFFPAEQYDFKLLETMAEMQAEGFGEVEVHLHHGIEKPDTAANLRKTLIEFRDRLAEQHRCLSRFDGVGEPVYAFVHGNLTLANSAHGKFCGVDEEMKILQETGCYADFTLPSAPDITQVPVINRIYECGLPLTEKISHRAGKQVAAYGRSPQLPLIFTGPLMLNWTRKIKGFPVPRLDDGALAANQPLNLARLNRWLAANITVQNRPEWIFVKLYCHGFFDHDQSSCIGDRAERFFTEIIEHGERKGNFAVHFATAREAFNIVLAAIDGKKGNPGKYRNYRLRTIMREQN